MKKIATVAAAGLTTVALGTGLVAAMPAASAAGGKDTTGHSKNRVTGEQAQKAIAAALAAVPGTADHAHATPDGGYRVKVTTADGKVIVVSLDAAFMVTGQQEAAGKGKTVITDDQRNRAGEAAVSAVPGATVLEVRKDRDGGFGVVVRTSDGVKKVVRLGSDYQVLSVQDAKKSGRGKHARGVEVTGETYTKAEAAALGQVPGGTVVDVHQRGSGYHVLVKRADGSQVCVTLDSAFTVTGTKAFRVKARF